MLQVNFKLHIAQTVLPENVANQYFSHFPNSSVPTFATITNPKTKQSLHTNGNFFIQFQPYRQSQYSVL